MRPMYIMRAFQNCRNAMKPWFDQTVHQNPQEFGRRVVVCAVDPDKGVPGVGGLLEVARD